MVIKTYMSVPNSKSFTDKFIGKIVKGLIVVLFFYTHLFTFQTPILVLIKYKIYFKIQECL
jgi:hypothetical protein